jgi:hypothetical protein
MQVYGYRYTIGIVTHAHEKNPPIENRYEIITRYKKTQ